MTAASQQIKDRTFWLQFIKEYERLPCLWNENHANYANRKVREQAFNTLLKKVRQVCPAAQLDFVKQRLNNFRRTFINEYNKVQESKKDGTRTYVPSLYYYNHLRFLKEDEAAQSPVSLFDEASDEETRFSSAPLKEEEFQSQDIATSDYSGDVDFIITSKAGSSPSNEFYLIHSSNNEDSRPTKRQRLLQEVSENNADEVGSSEYHLEEESENVVDTLIVESQNETQDKSEAVFSDVEIVQNVSKNARALPVTQVNSEDEFDVIAKRVAMHFREMNQQQCLYAEKLVFDVCINGRLNRLTEDSNLSILSSSTRQKNQSSFNS